MLKVNKVATYYYSTLVRNMQNTNIHKCVILFCCNSVWKYHVTSWHCMQQYQSLSVQQVLKVMVENSSMQLHNIRMQTIACHKTNRGFTSDFCKKM